MFGRVLIANRGEIARRIGRTARAMGIHTIAVYAEPDAKLPFVGEADEAIALDSPHGYADVDALVSVALRAHADAVHPGYGFRSENAGFARACQRSGLSWVGPSPESMALLADKVGARNHVAAHGVPVLPGTGHPVTDPALAIRHARELGYPLMVKAVSGGGGIGMGVAYDDEQLAACVRTASSRGEGVFGDAGVLLERYLPRARHVEVQVMGLPEGEVLTFAERDCSIQRRRQKVVEESPSPVVDEHLRRRLRDAARLVASSVHYRNAGTIEFLLDVTEDAFYFLEANTRLQVEHPITEAVHGVDLVRSQLLVAAGEAAPAPSAPRGHAVELRVCAEDPETFLPRPGVITGWVEPHGDGVRVDSGYVADTEVSRYFDPLLAKLVVHGAERAETLRRARVAVRAFTVTGPVCNLPLLRRLLDTPEFVSGDYDTTLLDRGSSRSRP